MFITKNYISIIDLTGVETEFLAATSTCATSITAIERMNVCMYDCNKNDFFYQFFSSFKYVLIAYRNLYMSLKKF